MDSGGENLKHHLETCKKNATYCSKTIQNQLIAIIGKAIQSTILAEVKIAKHFSLLADEVTDMANLEQLTLTIRYVDSRNEIREEFLEFKEAERITGDNLASMIKESIME